MKSHDGGPSLLTDSSYSIAKSTFHQHEQGKLVQEFSSARRKTTHPQIQRENMRGRKWTVLWNFVDIKNIKHGACENLEQA